MKIKDLRKMIDGLDDNLQIHCQFEGTVLPASKEDNLFSIENICKEPSGLYSVKNTKRSFKAFIVNY